MIQVLTRIGKRVSASTACAFFLAALLWLSPVALAEDITFPGTGLQLDTVISPSNYNSLFPTSLSDNTVTFNFGTIDGYVYGGAAKTGSPVTGNKVFFNDGQARGVYGGASRDGNGLISNNKVFINGGTVEYHVIGGYGIYSNSDATDNTVTITGGSIGGNVYGGYTDGGEKATGNRVIILGGTFSGSNSNVYGGRGQSLATSNTVTISGGTGFNQLYGGFIGVSGDDFTGNTLNVKTTDLIVGDLQNFQYLNFYLPATLAAGDTMLKLKQYGVADLTKETDADPLSSVVSLILDGSSISLRAGDSIVLIDASDHGDLIVNAGLNSTALIQGTQGLSLNYEFDITVNAKKLLASVKSVKLNERTKVLSEGFLASLILVRQAAEAVDELAIGEAVRVAREASLSTGHGLGGFGSVTGGLARYDTGSHIDMTHVSLVTGLAWGANLAPGFLTVSGFFEYSDGSFETENHFAGSASARGNGDNYLFGAGMAARLDFSGLGPGRFHLEASGRTGGVHNEFESLDLRNALGRHAQFDSYATYYGFHMGAGYEWDLSDMASLELYGKYYWALLDRNSLTLSTGESVFFDYARSSRLRFGGRVAFAVSDRLRPYLGVAWEHEFSGKAEATINGNEIDAPSLRGHTGIGELGLSFKPLETTPLNVDLGLKGYAGKREGLAGSLRVKMEF